MQSSSDMENDLAATYMNKANAVAELGDLRGAVVLYDRCIAIWERLVKHEGRSDLANCLATAYTNKAKAVEVIGKPDRLEKSEANWEGYYETANDNALMINKDIKKDLLVVRGQQEQCEVPRAVLAVALLMAKQWGWDGGTNLYELQSGRVTLKNIAKGVALTKYDSESLALILFNNVVKDIKNINDDDNSLIASVIRVCIEGEVTIYEHK